VSSACSSPTGLSEPGLPAHAATNRAAWDVLAADYVEPGRASWARAEPAWGIWGVPESELGVLPGDVSGLDVIELGCGTAYVSAWLARRGAKPVGIDNSARQLETARGLQAEHGLEFPLLHGNAESVPLPDASFDLVVSEYGASIWCDPYLWVPEAARLLRPGGRLIFLVNGTLLLLCSPDDENEPVQDRLLRDYFGLHRLEWTDEEPPTVSFALGYGDWIRLLGASGFAVEDLLEVRAPAGASTRYPWADPGWARRWPSEEVWKARKAW
jgi:SAM-dependent methyltransferase